MTRSARKSLRLKMTFGRHFACFQRTLSFLIVSTVRPLPVHWRVQRAHNTECARALAAGAPLPVLGRPPQPVVPRPAPLPPRMLFGVPPRPGGRVKHAATKKMGPADLVRWRQADAAGVAQERAEAQARLNNPPAPPIRNPLVPTVRILPIPIGSQREYRAPAVELCLSNTGFWAAWNRGGGRRGIAPPNMEPVSYTHLTLPTN